MACSTSSQSGFLKRPWVFMDAGDTFIYGYPTFYFALRDCFRNAGYEMDLGQAEKAVNEFIRKNPPLNLIDQEDFTRFFHNLYGSVLQSLDYRGDLRAGVDWLWNEWLKGERLRLFDDSLSALRRLRGAGFKLAVISNWDQTFDRSLERLGVSDLFEYTVSSVAVGMAKPDPRLFRYALEKTGATADRAWYLGDQLEADILPASALGFKTIYVDYYGKGGGDHLADFTAPSMSVAAEIVCAAETPIRPVDRIGSERD